MDTKNGNHFKLLLVFFISVLFLLVVVLGMTIYTSSELSELIKSLMPILDVLHAGGAP